MKFAFPQFVASTRGNFDSCHLISILLALFWPCLDGIDLNVVDLPLVFRQLDGSGDLGHFAVFYFHSFS